MRSPSSSTPHPKGPWLRKNRKKQAKREAQATEDLTVQIAVAGPGVEREAPGDNAANVLQLRPVPRAHLVGAPARQRALDLSGLGK